MDEGLTARTPKSSLEMLIDLMLHYDWTSIMHVGMYYQSANTITNRDMFRHRAVNS